MARGRPALPEAVKRLRGNPGKRKLRGDAAKLPPGEVQLGERDIAALPVAVAPKRLSAVAKEEWKRLAPELTRLGLLRMLDLVAFEIRCETYARWRKATSELARRITDVKREKLLLKVQADCAKQMKAFDSEFGLTPAARARVQHVTGNQQAPLPFEQQPKKNEAPTGEPAPGHKPVGDLNDDEFFGIQPTGQPH